MLDELARDGRIVDDENWDGLFVGVHKNLRTHVRNFQHELEVAKTTPTSRVYGSRRPARTTFTSVLNRAYLRARIANRPGNTANKRRTFGMEVHD